MNIRVARYWHKGRQSEPQTKHNASSVSAIRHRMPHVCAIERAVVAYSGNHQDAVRREFSDLREHTKKTRQQSHKKRYSSRSAQRFATKLHEKTPVVQNAQGVSRISLL